MKAHKLLIIVFSLVLAVAACGVSNGKSNNNNGKPGNNGKPNNNEKPNNLTEALVPLGGNTFLTKGPSNEEVTDKGITKWKTLSDVYSVFVWSKSPVKVKFGIQAKVASGVSIIQIKVGSISKKVTIKNTVHKPISVGKVKLKRGYNRFNITGLSKTGSTVAQITTLILHVPSGTHLTYVKSNKGNHFYWARRGPSVHLGYKVPKHIDIEWFYNEVTVPKGMDPIGSYFMADGFRQGYFGMQVNSSTERHILFSVWSPYNTNDPNQVPDSLRIKLLRKGTGVHTDKFGGEGSGGQSYWNFDWKTGVTYKFLVHVKPVKNKEKTVYTAFFYAPERGKWKLIASWLRPKTQTWYTGAYSFNENFIPRDGYKKRKAYYGNQWARDKNGKWYRITEATFTAPKTGGRLDSGGGTKNGRFYLVNGGFFTGTLPNDAHLSRNPTGKQPKINFSKLRKLHGKVPPRYRKRNIFPRNNWSVIGFDSQEKSASPEAAKNVLDGNVNTIWKSRWSNGVPGFPHYITIDMGKELGVHGFVFVQTQSGQRNIKNLTIKISKNDKNWTSLGRFQLVQDPRPQSLPLEKEKTFRYFKVIFQSAWDGGKVASMAEIEAY